MGEGNGRGRERDRSLGFDDGLETGMIGFGSNDTE